ncbi:MAG TPA: nitroreductase family protein [Thermoanaerobaculia bacterium]|nr:nitroreductase family protein [Thermoanaerobaculia bacterium]
MDNKQESMDGDFLSIITARHCKRAFLDRPVPRAVLEDVLRAAAHAPSTRNGQPWAVAVLLGDAKEALARRLCALFDSDAPMKMDYESRPAELPAVHLERAAAASLGVHAAKGIAQDDKAGRRAHLRDNMRFYGAPVAMIFHLPANAVPGTFLEMGLFVQNVLLGLAARGLGGCPQASVTGYSEAIREHLGLEDRLIVCGMSVGYPDESAAVNRFAPERAPLSDYTQWLE